MPERIFLISHWMDAIIAWTAKTFSTVVMLTACFAQISDARADSASCLAKATAFVAELRTRF
jgi:hypothetical protein